VNSRAKQLLGSYGLSETPGLNLYSDVLLAEAKQIFAQIESGVHEVRTANRAQGNKVHRADPVVPEPDWPSRGTLRANPKRNKQQDPATQLTIQEAVAGADYVSKFFWRHT